MQEKTRKSTTGGVLLGSDYDQARTKKMLAEAEMAEIELAKAQKLLVKADDVEKVWSSVLFAVRSKLLAIPSKSAPLLALETETNVVKSILEDSINEALAELSRYDPASDPVALSGSNAGEVAPVPTEDGPATKTEPRRVGRPKKGSRLSQ